LRVHGRGRLLVDWRYLCGIRRSQGLRIDLRQSRRPGFGVSCRLRGYIVDTGKP